MTKKHFIALANAIREHNRKGSNGWSPETHYFFDDQTEMLADFCQSQNSWFNRDRWLNYIAGNCGPNGGASK